jgi:hypothetical protein
VRAPAAIGFGYQLGKDRDLPLSPELLEAFDISDESRSLAIGCVEYFDQGDSENILGAPERHALDRPLSANLQRVVGALNHRRHRQNDAAGQYRLEIARQHVRQFAE